MRGTVSSFTTQRHSTLMSDVAQLGLPSQIDAGAVARKKSFGSAIELCAETAGYSLDKQLSGELGVDKGQFSRWQNGTEGILWPKLAKLMDVCGNDAPVLWMLHQRCYDLSSVRRLESETERQNRLLREEVSALRRALQVSAV